MLKKYIPQDIQIANIFRIFIKKLQEKSSIHVVSAHDMAVGVRGPEYDITKFYAKPEEYISEEIAPYEDTPLGTKLNIANFKDQKQSVKLEILNRLPPEKMLLLIDDPDPMIRETIINFMKFDFIDKEFLEKFVNDSSINVRRAAIKRTQRELLYLFANDTDPAIRRVVAMDSKLNDVLNMTNDPDEIVRQILKARREDDITQIEQLKKQVYEIL